MIIKVAFDDEFVSSNESRTFWLDINDIDKIDKSLFVSDFEELYKVFCSHEYSELFYKQNSNDEWESILS